MEMPSLIDVSMATRPPTAPSTSSEKTLRNLTPTPKYRAEQFPGGELLFCNFCQHCIDWKRKNTRNDQQKDKDINPQQ